MVSLLDPDRTQIGPDPKWIRPLLLYPFVRKVADGKIHVFGLVCESETGAHSYPNAAQPIIVSF